MKTIKRSDLQELIRHITRSVIKEFIGSSSSASSTSSNSSTDPNANTNVPPVDALSPAEKSKMERDKAENERQQLKQKKIELKSEKDKQRFYKSSEDQSKRVTQKGLERDIKNLQGAGLGPAIT